MNKLKEIKDLIEDLKDCVDGNGVPNIHYISNRIADLDKVVNTINYIPCCTQLLCIDKWCYNDLTKGNKYKMVTEDDEYYTIVNDWGEICQKDKDLFEIIKQ